jgi:hypothetical protein
VPARDISVIAEDMVDTLLEEGFDLETVYDTTQRALAEYLVPMQELVLGELATEDAVESAADEAAFLVINQIIRQRTVAAAVSGGDVVNEPTEPEPTVIAPTRFERDPVI